jgi:hypothetical protein
VLSGCSLSKIKHCFIDNNLFTKAYLLAFKIELVSRFSLQEFCFNGIQQNRSPPLNSSARFNLSKASRLSMSYADSCQNSKTAFQLTAQALFSLSSCSVS